MNLLSFHTASQRRLAAKMDTADLHPLVEDLDEDIGGLEEALAPLLKTSLSKSTSKLPLLDKAKAYVLATYALESVLFSCLRLNGVDAKSHPVFQELARVKEYFGKIKAAETGASKRNVALDKQAATRIIKHGLAGNERYDRDRADRVASEKAGAKRKLEDMAVGTHTRFDGAAKRMKASEGSAMLGGARDEEQDSSRDGPSLATSKIESGPSPTTSQAEKRARKVQRRLEKRLFQAGSVGEDSAIEGARSHVAPVQHSEQQIQPHSPSEVPESQTPGKKKKRKKSKGERLEDERADEMK